ncbi:MAG: hypothetical protein FD161_3575 [Limisphaerales bacterium]|nr:MAG: hypothetical protein FD161_3575 [Limisphaerales bacterium]KAG0507573.1 MAG: hypothetical protein E1N63_3241 [Limisphaerales bacterium]TXT48538.1 MAG: hypothetical protein FD140_3616 [Limisphaerales bacterium]
MGELLNGNGAQESHAATETRTTSAPRLSAGLSTLVRNAGEPPAPAANPSSLTLLRASLLAADLVLTGGAVLLFLNRQGTDWTATVIALLAVSFGAWLGWLGLTWGRDAR